MVEHRIETGENATGKCNPGKPSGLVGKEDRGQKLGQESLVNFTSGFWEAEMKQKQK